MAANVLHVYEIFFSFDSSHTSWNREQRISNAWPHEHRDIGTFYTFAMESGVERTTPRRTQGFFSTDPVTLSRVCISSSFQASDTIFLFTMFLKHERKRFLTLTSSFSSTLAPRPGPPSSSFRLPGGTGGDPRDAWSAAGLSRPLRFAQGGALGIFGKRGGKDRGLCRCYLFPFLHCGPRTPAQRCLHRLAG